MNCILHEICPKISYVNTRSEHLLFYTDQGGPTINFFLYVNAQKKHFLIAIFEVQACKYSSLDW